MEKCQGAGSDLQRRRKYTVSCIGGTSMTVMVLLVRQQYYQFLGALRREGGVVRYGLAMSGSGSRLRVVHIMPSTFLTALTGTEEMIRWDSIAGKCASVPLHVISFAQSSFL